MKCRNHSLAFLTMCLLATSTFLGGCTTTGMDRSVKTSNSIQEVDNEIRKMVVQIDVTGTALDSLVLAREPDLKKPFNTYSESLEKLDKEGKKVLKRLDEMKEQSTAYFAEWEKQGDAFTNPQIRELSAERRSALAELYAQVPKAGSGIRGSYHAYLTDLKEIQLYLSNDLTAKGIEGITPVAQKSVEDREALKSSLTPLLSALDEINSSLYSGKK